LHLEIIPTYLDSLRASRRTDQDRERLGAARVGGVAAARVNTRSTRGLTFVDIVGWTDGTIGVS